MTPVKSSTIDSIGYDAAHRRLTVKFKSGGTYSYDDVEPKHHAKLMTAESVGSWFHAHIKGKFKHTKHEEKAA